MRLERLLAIVLFLLERNKVQAKELAEMFNVSVRTIYRDITAINQAGIPIVTKTGAAGGLSIMKEFRLSKNIFTINDLSSILLGLTTISETFTDEKLQVALSKMLSLVPEKKQQEIFFRANQIVIEPFSWLGNKKVLQEQLVLIKRALDQQKVLTFAYINSLTAQTHRTVEPYKLLFKDNAWYLQGYCLQKAAFRVFKLSRITELKVAQSFTALRTPPVVFQSFSEAMTKKTIPIKLLINQAVLSQFLDLCGPENIEAVNETSYYAYFDFIEDDYGYGILLSFGDKCVCLEPAHVRQEMMNRLRSAYQQMEKIAEVAEE